MGPRGGSAADDLPLLLFHLPQTGDPSCQNWGHPPLSPLLLGADFQQGPSGTNASSGSVRVSR